MNTQVEGELRDQVQFVRDQMFTIQNIDWKKLNTVVVILTAPRSGSTVFKEALTNSPEVLWLSGEDEPYHRLAGAGFGLSSDSDAFEHPVLMPEFLDLIGSEVGVSRYFDESRVDYIARISQQLYNRLLMQWPGFMADVSWHDVHGSCHDHYENRHVPFIPVIREILPDQYLAFYDFCGNISGHWDKPLKIEEPPFILPKIKATPTTIELKENPLILKSPPNAYRIGLFDRLFPEAEIKYLHLTRGFAQTVNGLIDGWRHPFGFLSHDVSRVGEQLDIQGYTEQFPGFRNWWNFDLFPGWQEFTDSPLEEICLEQWYRPHNEIIRSGKKMYRVHFEDFIRNPQKTISRVAEFLDFNPIPVDELPKVMTTDEPKEYRWKKRKSLIRELAERPRVIKMMDCLGYSMDEDEWV